MTGISTAAFASLLTPAGRDLLDHATCGDIPSDPLQAATALRRTALARLCPAEREAGGVRLPGGEVVAVAELAGAALTQARLRRRAEEKFGPDARHMYFTPDGLEQATRTVVAEYRAARFAEAVSAAPERPVADLCCGIGGDLLALARRGLDVEGVDADPLAVEVAAANAAAFGLADRVAVRRAEVGPDMLSAAGTGYAAVFCDPARRGERGRVFDPDAYSPSWDTAVALARSASAACVKTAPGIAHELLPEDAGAEWISCGGEVKEAALWFGALRGARRQATLLPARPESGATAATLAAEPGLGAPPVAPVGRYLYEPDGAVIRAGLVAEAAARVDGALVDPRIAYITADRPVSTPFCRGYAVKEVLPFSVKRLRALVRQRRIGTITIKKRGSAVDVAKLHRDLKPSGPGSAVLVLTRIGSRPVCLICEEFQDEPLLRST